MLTTAQTPQSEEQIIAELERLGVRYLLRQFESAPAAPRAKNTDIDPNKFREYFETLRRMTKHS